VILDWLYPPTCMGCKILLPLNDKRRCAIWLCGECESLLERVPQGAFVYEGLLRDIIRDIKFRSKRNHARALGRLWAGESGLPRRGAIFAPVPLHPSKKRERGFNQAEILARELSRGLGLPMENALRRIVDTPPQAGLHPAMRIENVANAFRVAPQCTVAGKSFILVDDIYTTGASLNECARTLTAHGAKEVTWMTLAVTLKKKPEGLE